MTDIEKAYFVAGYIYAQAEQIVMDLFGETSIFTEQQKRAEINHVQKMLIKEVLCDYRQGLGGM